MKKWSFLCSLLFLITVEVTYSQDIPNLYDLREKILDCLGINTIYKRNNNSLTPFFHTLTFDIEIILKVTKDDFGNYYHFRLKDYELIFFEKLDKNIFLLEYLEIKINNETPFYSFFPCYDMTILEKYAHVFNSGIYYRNGFAEITYELETRHFITFSFENNRLIRCSIHRLID